METELGELAQIYAIYTSHVERLESHGPTLFAELDPKKLHAFSKEFIEKVEETKETPLGRKPVFELVEECILAFKSSLPLMEALKSDALRPRHWEQLLRITRQSRISIPTPRRSLSARCLAWSCTDSTSR